MAREAKHMTEAELTAALRALALGSSAQSVDPRLLESYMEGTASPEDVERLREILAQSGELREDLTGLAAVARGSLEFQTLLRPVVPKRRRKYETARPLRLIVGLAAALAIAAGLAHGMRQKAGQSLTLVADRAYYGEQFEMDALRGSAPSETRSPLNHREAALLAFRRILRWTEEGVVVQEAPPPPASSQNEHGISFRTAAGTTYQALLPADATNSRLAVLTLPALTLSWAELPTGRDEFQVPLPATATASQVFLAVAYETPTGFAAVLAVPR